MLRLAYQSEALQVSVSEGLVQVSLDITASIHYFDKINYAIQD